MKQMCYSQDMPMIPFEESYAIQHITHRFNPDGLMPVLTLVANSGRVLIQDAIPDIQEAHDLDDIKEKWLPILNQDYSRKKRDEHKRE